MHKKPGIPAFAAAALDPVIASLDAAARARPPTERFPARAGDAYLRRHEAVQGWLADFSAEAILALARYQSARAIRGPVAEIGVHHGRLFLLLYLATTTGEAAIAVDLFSMQHLNTDQSGRGNKAIFLRHVDRIAGSRDGLVVIEDSSFNVKAEQLMAHGRPRLFSIDGSHTEPATLNDLQLADATLAREGIVIVDDCFNEYWPEVTGALAKHLAAGTLVPFAITPGKVLLCRAPAAAVYQAFLRERFPRRIDKEAHLFGHPVLVTGVRPWTLRRAVGTTKVGAALKRIRAHLQQ